jgi:hypothetical protein
MSRRVYLLGVGLALVALAFVLTDALLWQAGVTEANVNRIRPGMSLEQAEGILGKATDARVLTKRLSVAIWKDDASYYVIALFMDRRVKWIRSSWYDAPKTPALLAPKGFSHPDG